MCGESHKREEAAAAVQSNFTQTMLKEGATVFGNADKVFNQLVAGSQKLFAAGPSQPGFSAAEANARNAAIVTQGANAARFAAARAGGGNVVGGSGVGTKANAGIATQIAGQVAGAENQVAQENWATGRENWKTAGSILGAAPGVYSPVADMNANTEKGVTADVEEAKAQDNEHPGALHHIMGGVQGAVKGFMEGGPAGAVAGGAAGVAQSYNDAGQSGGGMSTDQG